MKRVLALLLSAVLLIGLIVSFDPTAADGSEEGQNTGESHPNAEAIWKQIEALETEQFGVRGKNAAAVSEAVYELVAASDTTAEGSLDRHGDMFFWRTTDGEICGYSPRLRAKLRESGRDTGSEKQDADPISPSGEMRGGVPASRAVAVFQPFYGLDNSFTDQYRNEGLSIAVALGGTCSVYQTDDATIDQIAESLENSAIVIFDSHGLTDYEDGDDFTTNAHTSYICLTNGTGVTDDDRKTVIAEDNSQYYHVFNAGMFGTSAIYCVDGTAIANHMSKEAPNNLLWMAICFGMATDGLADPLHSKGVQTVYGYTQEVSFSGDYRYESAFFLAIKKGAAVRSAISLMKRTYGLWDPASDAGTVAEAKACKAAFPIVVSDEDPYPGRGNADGEQLVRSGWKAKDPDFLYGDVNCDGTVDASDASRVLRCLVMLGKMTQSGSLAADVNADGRLTAEDGAQILRRTTEMITEFPADR